MFVKFLRIAYRTTQKTTAAGRPHGRARFRRFQVGAKDTPGRLLQTRGTARWAIRCGLLAGGPAGGKRAPCGDAKSSHYSAAQQRGRSCDGCARRKG
jgi:hypothetical protein